MANFTGYYKTPDNPTVYGVAEGGQRVAFGDPTQLAQAQGGTTADFGQVKADPTFNPQGAINYSDYIKGLGQPTSNPTDQALAAAQASGPAPQTQGEANTALEAFAPKAPTFYKPTTPIEGYDPQTVFDTTGKPLSYDAFIAAGGKPDFSNVQSGMWPTQTPATGGAITQTPSKPTVSPFFEQQLALDPGYQQLLKSSQEFNSYINQQKSLTDSYKQLTAELGIPAMNTELMNMKNVIDGTEEDIRTEITKVGGFATESQVLALTNARNKQLIKNYNNLLQTKQMAMETLNTMTNLMGQDRQFAMQAIDQRFQIDKQIADYQVKMQDNARNAYEKIVEQVGYAGLAQMTGGDPYYTSLVEKTLGLGSGGLATLAAYKKPLTEAEKLDLEVKRANIKQSEAAIAKSNAEIAGIPLDEEMKRAQIANYWSEINQRNSPESGYKNEITKVDGADTLVTYDKAGNIINKQPLGQVPGATSTPQQQAKAKSQIDQINSILSNKNLGTSVGPNALFRIDVGSLRSIFTPSATNFIADVQQLVSQLNLDALIKAKSQGATFGALSDQELQVLASSATKIGTWALKDKNGNIVGYRAKEADFKKELDKINNFAKLDYILKGGNPADVNVQQTSDGKWVTPNSDGSYNRFTELEGRDFNSAGKPQASTNIKLGSPLAIANNNPGNLRYIGQAGATQGQGGFAKFSTPEAGVRALINDINDKKAPGGRLGPNSTLSEMITMYAPPNENNTQLYIQQIAQRLGISPNTKIGNIDTNKLAREIALKESSSYIG